MRKLTHTHKALNRAVLALVVIFSLNGIAMAARAEKGGWRDHAKEAHAWRQQHWHHGQSVYGDRGYVTTYAPPVVVDPPPAYYGAEPGVNLVFPLNFR
jgi:hypothetical protein